MTNDDSPTLPVPSLQVSYHFGDEHEHGWYLLVANPLAPESINIACWIHRGVDSLMGVAAIPVEEWPGYIARIMDFDDDDPHALADEIMTKLYADAGCEVPGGAKELFQPGLIDWIYENRKAQVEATS